MQKAAVGPMSTQSVRSTGETARGCQTRHCLSCGKDSLRGALSAAMEMAESLWLARTGRTFVQILALLREPHGCALTSFERSFAIESAQNCVFCKKPTKRVGGVLVEIQTRKVIGPVDSTCGDMANMTKKIAEIARFLDQLASASSADVTLIGNKLLEQIQACHDLAQTVRRQAVECVQ